MLGHCESGTMGGSVERLPDGRTLRVWVDGGYSIALLFDAGEVCLGVQDERIG